MDAAPEPVVCVDSVSQTILENLAGLSLGFFFTVEGDAVVGISQIILDRLTGGLPLAVVPSVSHTMRETAEGFQGLGEFPLPPLPLPLLSSTSADQSVVVVVLLQLVGADESPDSSAPMPEAVALPLIQFEVDVDQEAAGVLAFCVDEVFSGTIVF